MDIPVYLIAGFLDAGKTNFINGILRGRLRRRGPDPAASAARRASEEYDPQVLSNVFTVARWRTRSS